MASYLQKADPIYQNILANSSGCSYGDKQMEVIQHCFSMIKMYPEFQVSRQQFKPDGQAVPTLCLTLKGPGKFLSLILL